MEFEWDEEKNKINQKKHGISFEDARIISARKATNVESKIYVEGI